MILPIKLIIDQRARKDGTCALGIQYCYNSGKRTVLNTGIAIPRQHWNTRLSRINPELPPEYGDSAKLNSALLQMLRSAEDIVSFALDKKIDDPLNYLKKVFAPGQPTPALLDPSKLASPSPSALPEKITSTETELDFFTQLDEYIRTKTRKVSPGMTRNYRVMKERLLAFEKFRRKKIRFQHLDYNFYEEFINYLTYDHVHLRKLTVIRGLKRNSIGSSVKQLRIFLRDRMRRKIVAPIDLTDYKIFDEETDAIYLSTAEIRTIYELDLAGHPQLMRFRDLFVLGCFTGLRFSDYSNIKPEDIRDGMLYKKQGKSDHWVVIPLRPEAADILLHRFNKVIPRTTNTELNRNIKFIGHLAGITAPIKGSYKKGNQDIEILKPKCDWISTHTCRRSFCTNEFLAGTPPELIMKISGHKSLKDFYKYIRITPEEAGKKIQEIWHQRGEMHPPDRAQKNPDACRAAANRE